MVTDVKIISAECPRKRILDVGKEYGTIVYRVRAVSPLLPLEGG